MEVSVSQQGRYLNLIIIIKAYARLVFSKGNAHENIWE